MTDGAFDRLLLEFRGAAGDAPLSIFIDPTLRDPTIHDEPLRQALHLALERGMATRYRLPQIHDDFDPGRHPFLIHVASELQAEALVAAACRVALAEVWEVEAPEFTGRTVCGFILHDHHPAIRARALSLTARVRKPDGRRHFLRFWDPRVCWHLQHRLQVAHWEEVIKAMGQWMLLDPFRHLVALQSVESGQMGTAPQSDPSVQSIDAITWQRLERIAPTNKLLAMSWDWGLQPTVALARQIDELLVRCADKGFDSEQDVLVFAACGLTSHPLFDRHPHVHDALRRGAAAGVPLQGALSAFDETFWAQLQADTSWLDDAPPISDHGTTTRATV